MYMKNFKELIIWQKGIEIVKKIYHLTKQFPTQEKYGLQTYLVIVKDMQWTSVDEIIQIELILEEEIKMIHSFIKKAKS